MFYLPSAGADDWRRLLVDPEKQWRPGYSAHALAQAWESARGFPPEVRACLSDRFVECEPLFAVPEYKVPLPGGSRPSQNDLFVLARLDGELGVIMVEGKVAEPFGPTLTDWLKDASAGKRERLAHLQTMLGLQDIGGHIRYQLLHRTASALIEARRFNSRYAVLLVHSFSAENAWLEDFQAFTALYGARCDCGRLQRLADRDGCGLLAAWVKGPLPATRP